MADWQVGHLVVDLFFIADSGSTSGPGKVLLAACGSGTGGRIGSADLTITGADSTGVTGTTGGGAGFDSATGVAGFDSSALVE